MNKLFQKKCPLCETKFDFFARQCPNCGFCKPFGKKTTIFIFVITLLFFSFIFKPVENVNLGKLDPSAAQKEKTDPPVFEKIKLRPMSELSGLSKEEILKNRTRYVKESLVFKNLKNYKPSEEVYQIEDHLPWIGAEQIAKYGAQNNKNIGLGPSRHSTSINNPELLASFIIPNFGNQKNKTYSKDDLLLPVALFYDKNNNVIKAEFNLGAFFEQNPKYLGTSMYIDETNARDLGYNWFYCTKKQNVRFINPKNSMFLRPYKIQGFYHKGYSCGLESGCNNYSPYQEPLVFSILDMPSSLTINLYKEKPKNLKQKPDMIYTMIF